MKLILDLSYESPSPELNGWKLRHRQAVNALPTHPVAAGIAAWAAYAKKHAKRFESDIGEDYVLGPAWARWGIALRELLNGELGHLDGGTLDHIIYTNLCSQGFDPDTWQG